MKRFIVLMISAIMISVSVSAMSYGEAKQEARYLTDMMAYDLGLSPREYDQVYNINLRYLQNLRYERDLYSSSWDFRNTALRALFGIDIWNRYSKISYFYRPVSWNRGRFVHHVYTYYPHYKKNREVVYYPSSPGRDVPYGKMKNYDKHWDKKGHHRDYDEMYNYSNGKKNGHYKNGKRW
ncbi:MAG: hypothetical protein WAR39_08670 [Prevotella sp.]